MDNLNIPTKRNLLLARQRLALARKGYDLLDKKWQVLVKELAAIQKHAGQTKDDLCDALRFALAAQHAAQAEMSRERVLEICPDMPAGTAVEIYFRSIMGVAVPLISAVGIKNNETAVPYSLCNTTASFDEAVLAWQKSRELIVTWAAIENTIHQLNLHIKKTQKRANALKNITIPKYEARIKYIYERLEERERDELARLKTVKDRNRQ